MCQQLPLPRQQIERINFPGNHRVHLSSLKYTQSSIYACTNQPFSESIPHVFQEISIGLFLKKISDGNWCNVFEIINLLANDPKKM